MTQAFSREKFFEHYCRAFGGLKQGQVDGLNFLLNAIELYDWKDVRWTAYLLATIKHETAHKFQPIKEYRNRVGSRGRANQDRYWKTGYFGRGCIQITWLANYAKASKELGVDLVTDPALALVPVHAFGIAARGMSEGWFTGKRLGQYINEVKCDYVNARRVVNGLDKAEEIALVASKFEYILRASAVEVGLGGQAARGGAGRAGDAPAPAPTNPFGLSEEEARRNEDYLKGKDLEKNMQTDHAKSGEPTPDVSAKAGEPVVGGRPEDPSVQVTDSTKARVYAAIPLLVAASGAIWSYYTGTADRFGQLIIVALALGIALIFRNLIIEIVRMAIRADPSKYNVK